ncbi:MAG: hypothetical protein ACREKS_23410, partial [Candidatus Rokuibacteriota bacterium]
VVQVGGTIGARLKGVRDTVTLYDVVALRGRYAASLPVRPRASLVRLDPPLPIVCHPVEDSQVVDGGIAGQVTRASRETLEVRLARPVELRSTLLVVLCDAGRGEGAEAYGKVAAIDPAPDGGVVITLALTAMPPDARRLLEEQVAAHA